MVEKPITNSLEETLKLNELQKKYNKSITAVHNHKFYPSVESLMNKIHNNELGEILSIYREFSYTDKVRMMEENHGHILYLAEDFLKQTLIAYIYYTQ